MVQCLKMNKEQKDVEITNREIPSAFEGEYVNSITLSLVKDAGRVALQVRNQGLEAQEKSSKEDLLTNGDTEVTRKIKPQLQSIFPDIQFLDEETPATHTIDVTQPGLYAIIDPI